MKSKLAGSALAIGAVGAAAGAATLAYSMYEAKQYTLRSARVPVLRPDDGHFSILHLSDMHMTTAQRDKISWISGLAQLMPDFVVVTGDFLSAADAVPTVVEALGDLLDVPGAFVLGSNDYYAPRASNPLGYLFGPSKRDLNQPPDLPWDELVAALTSRGWTDLDNARAQIVVDGKVIDARGVDDPHIGRDYYDPIAGPFDDAAFLKLGVAHAPYLRVLDEMAADGADLILAGHTHGGQVCVPGYGALVTNCDLDTGRVKGVHSHNGSWMHVSAGLGTAPSTPFRLACLPEATLLTLVPATDRPFR